MKFATAWNIACFPHRASDKRLVQADEVLRKAWKEMGEGHHTLLAQAISDLSAEFHRRAKRPSYLAS